jgi:hypothetical protein
MFCSIRDSKKLSLEEKEYCSTNCEGRRVVFVANGAMYIPVPKGGSSSVRKAMVESTGVEGAKTLQRIVKVEDIERSNLFRFSMVRNPVDRFVSFYYSGIYQHGKVVARNNDRLQKGLSLEDVLDAVIETPPEECNEHYVPQSLLLYNGGKCLCHYIARIEKKVHQWKIIRAVTGLGPLPYVAFNAHSSASEVLNDRMLLKLYEYYRSDFELFGYTLLGRETKSVHVDCECPCETSGPFHSSPFRMPG